MFRGAGTRTGAAIPITTITGERANYIARAEERAAIWARENAEAILSYNDRIKRRGIFGQDLRRW